MQGTKIYRVFASFSRYEMNRLEKFIESPYFNKNEKITTAFKLLKASIISESPINEQVMALELGFALKEIAKFRKVISQLLSLVQDFLAMEEYKSNSLLQANTLLTAINSKKLTILYNSAKSKAQRLSERHLHKSSDYYYQKYRFETQFYEMSGVDVSREKKKVIEELNTVKTAQLLDVFYFIEKIKSEIQLLYWSNVYELEYSQTFKDEILEHLEVSAYNIPALDIYHLAYLCFAEPENDEHYHKLYELIHTFIDIFPKEEANDIIEAAINYTIRKSNQGNRTYLRELFKLYQEAIHSETIYQNGLLSSVTFKNICTAALRLKEFDWAHQFIENQQDKLDSKARKSLVNLAKSQVYFYQKKLDQVLPLLQDYESQDPNLNLTAKLLSCVALYELDLYDVLESQMESFKVLLYRKSAITNYTQKRYKNFLGYLKKILNFGVDKKRLRDLYKEISVNKDLPNATWLLEKIEDIIGPVSVPKST